jgi:mannopine transport system permease protein
VSTDQTTATPQLPLLRIGLPATGGLSSSVARGIGGLAIAAILFFLMLPTLVIIPMSLSSGEYMEFPPRGLSLRWYQAFFADPEWLAATFFSLKIALSTTLAAAVIGTLASLALVRGQVVGKPIIQALSMGPMIVPHIVLGVALYLVFAPMQLTGNFVGFLVAHSVLSVPYVVITISAALQRLDPVLELAALSCGASRPRAFFSVVLPNIAPSIAAACIFAFLASFDEATVAFFISDTGGKTISRKMFEDIDFNLTPVIAAASTLLVGISLMLMGAVQAFSKRR